jgi:hypothetical protein
MKLYEATPIPATSFSGCSAVAFTNTNGVAPSDFAMEILQEGLQAIQDDLIWSFRLCFRRLGANFPGRTLMGTSTQPDQAKATGGQ